MKKQSKKVTPEQSAIDTYKMRTVDQMVKYFAPDVGRKTGNVMTQNRFRMVCETLYEQFIQPNETTGVTPGNVQIKPHLTYFDTNSGIMWSGKTLLEMGKLGIDINTNGDDSKTVTVMVKKKITFRMILRRIFTKQK